ncbi:DUF6603 domain-containing protein [Streptomyces sp. NPDC046915]|uniref:DUF6603 domain-containing protein n=1 Tax=Streptomyces sp. NPDC046915 TaxID=3155257 RepID=UPI0033C0472B
MAIKVEELRQLLGSHSDPGQVVEVPCEAFGPGAAFRPFFDDGVLRARWETGDVDALSFSGVADTALAEGPVPVQVAFSHNGAPEVTGVELVAELPEPGTTVRELAGDLGIDTPTLPDGVRVTRVGLAQEDGTSVLTGGGAQGRVAVVSRPEAGALVMAEGAAGWLVLCADRDLSRDQLAMLARCVPELPVPALADGLARGSWLVLPGPVPMVVPVRPELPRPELDPDRRDGLNRVMPARTETARTAAEARRGIRRVPHAIATEDGYVVLAPGALRRARGRFGLAAPAAYVPGRGWVDFGELAEGASVSVEYQNSPLTVSGGLAALPAQPPYAIVVGGVLVVDTGTISGSAVAAAYLPTAGGKPSFFAFGALGSDKGIGPPMFQVRGIAGGMGWRSNLRMPGPVDLADFPFMKALGDPGSIGAAPGGDTDPLAVLEKLTSGADPWVTPAGAGQDPLWIAAGLAFTVAERLDGRAMMILQTGEDLTLGLLGLAGIQFPKEPGRRKYANVEIGVEVVLKPRAGELSWSAGLTPNSYLLDPNCKLRGGIAAKIWFGPSPHAGDFVVSIGGYHRNYRKPGNYPAVPRLGFDWDLAGNVTVSGSAYLALTPAAVMAGGGLEVRFQSGALRAWLTAQVDALVQWKPFYVDVGLRVSVGVQARIKIWFVKITITVEVGVSLRVWGPPTGGQAKIHLWFISFTVGFGKDRDTDDNALTWSDFRTMLPPGDAAVRVMPGAGLISDRLYGGDGTRAVEDAWQVSSAGFTFSTDSAVPVTELYLNTGTSSPTERGSKLNIRPMQLSERTSTQRVSLKRDQSAVDLTTWKRSRGTVSVPQALWGAGKGSTLPAPGEQTIPHQMTGVRLSTPDPEYGFTTGYITEEAFRFDPIDPDGTQPLNPSAGPVGPVPDRPSGVIGTIAETVNAPSQKADRGALADALRGLGLDLGQLNNDLSAHATAAPTAFADAPMLVTTP